MELITSLIPPISLLPGYILVMIQCYLFTRLVMIFLPPKKEKWQKYILFLASLGLVNTIVVIDQTFEVLTMLSVFVLFVCILCKGRLIAKITVGMIFGILPIAVNGLLYELMLYNSIFGIVIRPLFWLILLISLGKILPKEMDDLFDSPRTWRLASFLAFMPVACTLAIVLFTELTPLGLDPDPFKDTLVIYNRTVILVVLACAAIGCVSMLFVLAYFSKTERMAREQVLLILQKQYYENLEQAQQQVRQLRHDMANHFTVMLGLEDKAMREYLESLIASPAMNSGKRFSENEIINAVLSSKAALMEKENTPYSFTVQIPENIGISELDLCAVTANILDNAIEASQKLPPENRSINFNAKAAKGFLVIAAENSIIEKPDIDGGKIKTTKKDKSRHGFGLAGIKEIARRHDGNVSISADDNLFSISVQIPLV